MIISIEIDQKTIDDALDEPHSRYWCREFGWEDGKGYVIDAEEDDQIVEFDLEDVHDALEYIAAHRPQLFAQIISGDHDGLDRDLFLQYCAFGEAKYG